ncbi:hypothetical protein [Planomicrobium sp. Y74]|uniref:hypothetical protein n=1 Tax=Planomicrobium sp. Y74 TaxID=2478977 RepID=UPI000EF4F21B|nr:hypothetical protein [Planomicrobium sp. Y74]RLQ92812.1 hypothetical protein D9754_02000 [Planomicrobium sp. Y74]
MLKKVFSVLSAFCFILLILPLVLPYSPDGFDLLEAILNITVFLPVILGVAGIVLALIGMKGQVKLYLVLFNAFGLGFYLLATFMGLFGFKER